MKPEPLWINKTALLLLHDASLARFGGQSGIRDEGLLESALARPIHRFQYEPECTLAELAAAGAYGIARNHPFIDGSKRAALLAIGVFLAMNGYRLVAAPVEVIRVMLALADGKTNESELAVWVGAHMVESAGPDVSPSRGR